MNVNQLIERLEQLKQEGHGLVTVSYVNSCMSYGDDDREVDSANLMPANKREDRPEQVIILG